MLLPFQGVSYLSDSPRAMPWAMCFWALAFPSAADLFDVQPACHVIVDNYKFFVYIFRPPPLSGSTIYSPDTYSDVINIGLPFMGGAGGGSPYSNLITPGAAEVSEAGCSSLTFSEFEP